MSVDDEIRIDNMPTIKCEERPELVGIVTKGLEKAYKILGIPEPKLVPTEIVFREVPSLGQVDVLPTGIQIVCDPIFKTENPEYPKVEVILTHEFGHIGLWGITGQERQPVTRLFDEGWASVVEDAAGDDVESIEQLEQKTKGEVRNGIVNHPEAYERCLEIDKPVTQEERPKYAEESTVGGAFLLWVRSKHGNQAMIELLKNTPWVAKRNDEKFESINLKEDWEHNDEYKELVKKVETGEIKPDDFPQAAYDWERKQLSWAILKTTGMKDMNEVKGEFRRWVEDMEVRVED